MIGFKRLQLGEEVTTLVALLSIFSCNDQGYTRIQFTVLIQHDWISWAKLAWFGTFQLGTIPVYTTGKSKRTIPWRT